MKNYKNVIIRNHTFEIKYKLEENSVSTVDLPIDLLNAWLLSFGDRIPTRSEFVEWKKDNQSNPHATHTRTRPSNTNVDMGNTNIKR